MTFREVAEHPLVGLQSDAPLQRSIDQIEPHREPCGKIGAMRHDDQNRVLLLLQGEEQRRDRIGRSPIEVPCRLIA